MHLWIVWRDGAFRSAQCTLCSCSLSNTKCSTAHERLEVRCSSLPPHEGAGRVGHAVGSACSALLRRMRVFTRPVLGRFSRPGLRSSRGSPGDLAARGLGSFTARRFRRAGGPILPVSLRFHFPGGSALQVRFASQPDAGLRVLPLGHAPVVTGLLADGHAEKPRTPRHLKATPAAALTS